MTLPEKSLSIKIKIVTEAIMATEQKYLWKRS